MASVTCCDIYTCSLFADSAGGVTNPPVDSVIDRQLRHIAHGKTRQRTCLSADDVTSPPIDGVGDCIFTGEGAGVLEIKCPFNKGNPNSATAPKLPQWYYMPQVISV